MSTLEVPEEATRLSRSLVDAAAEAARRERVRSLKETGKSSTDNAQAAAAVAAVLETLAKHHFDNGGLFGAAHIVELRRLAAEVREGR